MALPEPPVYPDLKGKIILITGVGQQGDPEMWGEMIASSMARSNESNGDLQAMVQQQLEYLLNKVAKSSAVISILRVPSTLKRRSKQKVARLK